MQPFTYDIERHVFAPSTLESTPAVEPITSLPAVDLSSELSNALRALSSFQLPAIAAIAKGEPSSTPRALIDIRELLHNKEQAASAVGFLNSTAAQTLAQQYPGRATALLLALSEIDLQNPGPFLDGCLNLLSSHTSRLNEDLIRLTGDALLKTSLASERGDIQKEVKNTVVEHAMNIFCDLSCFSLQHSPELKSWITYFKRELNEEQALNLVTILANRLDSGKVLSGYDHIVAAINGCAHRETVLQYADLIGRATISREHSTAMNEKEQGNLTEPQPIPLTSILLGIGISAAISSVATGSAPGFGFAVLAGTFLLLRKFYNEQVVPQLIEKHNNPPPITNPQQIAWNVFYEKLRDYTLPMA